MRRVALLALFALGGCSSLVRQTVRASSGSSYALATTEQRMRDALVGSRWDAALRSAGSEKQGGPGDRLLRELYTGTAAYYAGKFAESATAFERAAATADDRYTRSASRAALSIATSDLALPYVPGQNERLLVHYYGILTWLKQGSLGDAAVEARRLGALLQRYDDDRTPLDAGTRATLRYLTGTVFLAAGDTNDAAVAFRNARALGADADTLRAPSRHAADSGDVLVVVEQGFVAHRVEQRLTVRGGGTPWRSYGGEASSSDAIARAASMLTGDAGLWADGGSLSLDDAAPNDSSEHHAITRIVWPAYRRPAATYPAALMIDSTTMSLRVRADLSSAEAGDFRRDRAVRLARLLVRAALREGAASQLEKKHDDLASLLRTVGRAVERADTRSWHLLPGAIAVARVRLPIGTHALTAQVGGEQVSLGTVDVRPHGLAFATTRVW